MATYENDLRLKEITTGDEAGTWGTSTNTNLGLVAEAFSYGVENIGSDANATITVADGSTDEARSLYLKITSTTLSATRTVTLAPQSLSKVWIIENATTGGQSLVITQGGGQHGVTIPSGQVKVVYSTGDSESPSGVYDAFDSLAVTLAANAVGTANITDANVTLAKMAVNSVNASNIIAASITDTELAANAVVTAGITDANVTTAKIATNAINASKIINASITSTEMAPNAVEAVNIAANAVTTVKITDVNVTTAKIADDAVTAAKLATNAVVTASIVAGSVTAAEIANNAITSNEIGALANLTVTGDVTIDSSTSPAQSTLKVDSSNNRVGIGVDSPDVSLDIGSMTDSIHVPVGTTAQRPGSPAAGYFRYNTTNEQFEGYTTEWGAIGGGGGTNTFTTDTFTSATSPGVDGSTTAFHLSQTVSDENDIIVFIDGVFQNKDAYTIATASGETTLTFDTAPASGRTITVYTVATAVSGSNLGISTMTGDASDTTLTLTADPVHENNVQVYFDGVYQSKSNYTVDGTTLTFSDAPPDGVLVEAMTLTQTDINTATKLLDADKDTMIQVEESSDEDIIRFDTAGTERMTIAADGTISFADNNITNVGTISLDSIVSDASPSVITIGHEGSPFGRDSLVIKGSVLIGEDLGDAFNADSVLRIQRSNDRAFLQFKTDADQESAILFGDVDDDVECAIEYEPANKALTFSTGNNTEAVRIDEDQNVGIGVSPNYGKVNITTTGTGAQDRALWVECSPASSGSNNNAMVVNVGNGNMTNTVMRIHHESPAANQKLLSLDTTGSNTEKFWVDEDGDAYLAGFVGIGNTVAGTMNGLNGFGDLTIGKGASDHAGITIFSGTAHQGAICFADGSDTAANSYRGVINYNHDDNSMTFFTNNTERMRIKTDGKTGIGTNNPGGRFMIEADGSSEDILVINNTRSGSNSTAIQQFKREGTNTGFIANTSSATSYATTQSDVRAKKNFEDWTENVLPYFKTLKPQKFHFTQEEDSAEKTKGYIAQDLVDSFPEAYPLKDAGEDAGRYFFNPSGMVVYLMKATQEQQTQIEALEAKVKALEEA